MAKYRFDTPGRGINLNKSKYNFGIVPINPKGLLLKYGKSFALSEAFDKEREHDQPGGSMFPLNVRENDINSTIPEGRMEFYWGDLDDDPSGGFAEQFICDNVTTNLYRSKIVNRSYIQGKSGSISEYYASKDYDIVLYLQLFENVPDRVPVNQLQAVVNMYESNELVFIKNNFLNEHFGISYIGIDDMDVKQSPILNVQNVTLYCVSDYVKIDN